MGENGSFALGTGEMKQKNWDALHANKDFLKTGPVIIYILNQKAISQILKTGEAGDINTRNIFIVQVVPKSLIWTYFLTFIIFNKLPSLFIFTSGRLYNPPPTPETNL